MKDVVRLATIVDWEALLEVGLAAMAAGVGVAFTVSLTIFASTRSAEAAREGRGLATAAYAMIGIAAFITSAAAIVGGLIVMAT